MKMKIIAISMSLILSVMLNLYAKDVYIDGYYRKDGTYVSPHIRSSPDSSRSNNYGPSNAPNELMNPKSRDNDRDGVPNFNDTDDNNNGISDESDSNQYRLN